MRIGEMIRDLRVKNNLLLRELADELKIDVALLSKIERGERTATKKQVISLANYFNLNQNEFLSQWLGEKIAYEIKDEEIACQALKIAEQEINYYNKSGKELKYV